MASLPELFPASPIGDIDYAGLYDEQFFADYLADRPSLAFRQRQAMYGQEFRRITRYVHSGRVVDFGCGLGDFLELFDPAQWQRYGIEVAPLALKALRARGIETNPFREPDGSFDLVIFRGTIHHIDEPMIAINEALGNIAGQLIALPDGGGFLIKGRSVAPAATLSGSLAER